MTTKLREVGKVLSAKNQTALRAALDQLATVLQLVTPAEPDGVAPDESQVAHELGVNVGEAFGVRLHECSAECVPVLEDMREAKGLSFNTVQEGISRALRDKYPPLPGEYSSVWAREVFDEYFVWSDGKGQLYKSTYSVDEAGKVTMTGDSVKVVERKSYVVVKMNEAALSEAIPASANYRKAAAGASATCGSCSHYSAGRCSLYDANVSAGYVSSGYSAATAESVEPNLGGFVMLNEASAVSNDGKGLVKLISPGWGSSGYYSPQVLQDAAKAKVFGRGTKMYWDHPTADEEAARPERSLRDLSAVLDEDARWDAVGPKGKDGKTRGPGLYAETTVLKAYRDSVNDLAPHIGVSIRALGKASEGVAEGKKGRIIDSLAQARSVDFVTSPGRGGEILQLFEAARDKAYMTFTESGSQEGDGDSVSEAELLEARQRFEAAEKENVTLRATAAANAAQLLVTKMVSEADLPTLARTRLIEALVIGLPVSDKGVLDESALKDKVQKAIVAEANYILELTGRKATGSAPDVRGMGGIQESSRTDDGQPDEKAMKAAEAELAGAFKLLGLSESEAAIAAVGRA